MTAYHLRLVLEFVDEVACPVEFADCLGVEGELGAQVDGSGLIVAYLHVHVSECVEGDFAKQGGLFEPAGDIEPVAG
ncbi:TPA: hypothetical protein JAL21_000609 [Corynebacterium striatum]|nr:hypothetical protein [Corynebacterium striatum]